MQLETYYELFQIGMWMFPARRAKELKTWIVNHQFMLMNRSDNSFTRASWVLPLDMVDKLTSP